MSTEKSAHRKSYTGTVISDKMDKTVVVAIDTLVKHPRYKKYIKRRVKYMAHDEQNICGSGDKVLIIETRPLSANKRWRVKDVVEKSK